MILEARRIPNMKVLVAFIIFTALVALEVSAKSCDHVYNTTKAINITSPNFSSPYQPGQICHYILESDKPVQLYMHLLNLNLRPGDTLVIMNGTNDKHTAVIANFSNSIDTATNQILLYSVASNTTIIFTASSTTASSESEDLDAFGFILEVVPDYCNFNFTNVNSAVLSTPIYQKSVGYMNCTYNIQLGSETANLGLSFNHVDIQQGNLTINSRTYKDGTKSVDDVILSTNLETLKFNLSTDVVDNGFDAAYNTLSSDCPSVIILSLNETHKFRSPGSPANYSNNLYCRTIIKAPEGKKLWFKYEHFDMADQYDHVVMNDGGSKSSRLIAVFNKGNVPMEPLVTSSNKLWLQFSTDESETATGFILSIRVIAHGGTYLNEGTFVVMDSGTALPMSGTQEDDILIQLVTSDHLELRLHFVSEMLLPGSSIDCYDGLSQDDPHIATLRSQKPFYTVFTKGHLMLIVIRGFIGNDSYISNQTLTGQFTSVNPANCSKYTLDGSDTYQLTSRDVKDTNATWLIHKPKEGAMVLKFWKLNIQHHSVSVYQGLSDLSTRITHIHGELSILPVIYLNSDSRVSYDQILSPPVNGSGEDVVFSASSIPVQSCNMRVNTTSGLVTSPLYPDMYPLNAHCVYQIDTANRSVHLVFSQLQLAENHRVNIRVGKLDGNVTTLVSYDHQSNPTDIITSDHSKEIIIDFSSQEYERENVITSSGFKLSYDVLECGGNITNMQHGNISTPNYPAAITTNTTCVWIITLPDNITSNAAVNILNFTYNIQHYHAVKGNLLEIKDGGINSSDSLDVHMEKGYSNMTLSRSNQLWIKYTFTASNKSKGFAFSMKFTTYECHSLCGDGICIHPDWRCNGIDNCGDMTDEQNCTTTPHDNGVKPWILGVSIVLTFFVAVAITLLVPILFKKIRRGRGYDDLIEDYTPVVDS